VRVLQLALLSLNYKLPVTTKQYRSAPDGMFGPETLAAVKGFQGAHGLMIDGIVGTQTLGKLNALFSTAVQGLPPTCGNCLNKLGPFTPPHLIQAALGASEESGKGDSAKVPTKAPRRLNKDEREKARSVFGDSLTFNFLVTNGLGMDGRAFVAVVPVPILGKTVVVNWGDSPDDDTFFHELTHVWQAQHHFTPEAFMANALVSQAAAKKDGGSAYAFIPGRDFFRYGAEQIAQQVQRGKTDIISHIKAFPAGVPDPTNLPVPGLPFWETVGAPGVEK
jgi:hypothetical protein